VEPDVVAAPDVDADAEVAADVEDAAVPDVVVVGVVLQSGAFPFWHLHFPSVVLQYPFP